MNYMHAVHAGLAPYNSSPLADCVRLILQVTAAALWYLWFDIVLI